MAALGKFCPKNEQSLMSGGVLSNMYVVCKIALFLGHPVPKSHLYDDKIWRHYASGASRSLCSKVIYQGVMSSGRICWLRILDSLSQHF